jgi:hypothetical protein
MQVGREKAAENRERIMETAAPDVSRSTSAAPAQ